MFAWPSATDRVNKSFVFSKHSCFVWLQGFAAMFGFSQKLLQFTMLGQQSQAVRKTAKLIEEVIILP